MSEHDAFEEEMLFRTLSDADVDRLLKGRALEASQFAEVAEFSRALQGTLAARPARDEVDLVRQLAAAARSASLNGEAETTPIVATARPRARRLQLLRPRLAAVARVAGVLALIPLLFAGLAFADVTLPDPARKAFEAVGVDLPNQPSADERGIETTEDTAGETAGESGDDASAKSEQKQGKGGANETALEKRKHGTTKPNPARAGGRGNDEQGQGRALGKRGLAPGQLQPPGQTHAPGQLKKDSGGQAGEKSSPAPPATSSKPVNPPGKVNPKPVEGSAGGGKGS